MVEQNESTAACPDNKSSKDESSKKAELLKHPNLWRAGQLTATQARPAIATGFSQLDEHLNGSGWPAGGLIELLLPCSGIGELRLLAPALRALSHSENRWLAWVNPPFIPYAPALQAMDIDSNKILLIHPRSHTDALWALERACKSGSCSSVFAWLDEKKFSAKDSQRLQLAARQGRTLACLFRPAEARERASMAELRLALHGIQHDQVRVDILKRRGGWAVQDIVLSLPAVNAPSRQLIKEQLTLWRTERSEQSVQQGRQGRDADENQVGGRPLTPHLPVVPATESVARDNLQVH